MENQYWNDYYSDGKRKAAPDIPSQFAAFIATEFRNVRPTIVDVGCGNGRDTRFFSYSGFTTIGVDASQTAIERCQAASLGAEDSQFICGSLGDRSLEQRVIDILGDDHALLYARFFLHAISDKDEESFFDLADAVCGNTGSIAVEFRSDKDEALSKATASHFRRFINPTAFLERAVGRGYIATYFVEGFGFAKFENDDAHVARVLLQPRKG